MTEIYAFTDYGLLLTDNIIENIAKKALDKTTMQTIKNHENKQKYLCELKNHLKEQGVCDVIYNFQGETLEIDNNGIPTSGNNTKYFNNDNVAYIPTDHYPALFHKAYDNMEDILNEFKNKIGKYLPDNFDYRGNFKYISGTQSC